MWEKAGKFSEMVDNTGKTVDVGGHSIALFKSGGSIYAIDNICPHRGGPLGEGYLEEGVVTCPWHAWTFDVKTGECQSVPGISQKRYNVKIEGDDILVEVGN
jgi:NAD(P)H-dependent nitrite reductase small subunit